MEVDVSYFFFIADRLLYPGSRCLSMFIGRARLAIHSFIDADGFW